jgi:hypothetical protein
MIVEFDADSSRIMGDHVNLKVSVDMPLSMPMAWPMILLEVVMMIARHEVYEYLKVDGEWVYRPHDNKLDFRDCPDINIETMRVA